MKALDEIFSLLSKERRRYALYYLDQADGTVSIDELAEQIHEWETQSFHDPIPPDEYENLVISLEHSHLPKIEKATYIEFERENQQIRISGLSPECSVLLAVSAAIEQPSRSTDIAFGGDL